MPLGTGGGSASERGGVADLTGAGFTCRREVLYEAELVRSLSSATIAAIKDQTIDSVVFFSPRTAETFVALVRKARLVQSVRKLTALCLSQAVADSGKALGIPALGRTVGSPGIQYQPFVHPDKIAGLRFFICRYFKLQWVVVPFNPESLQQFKIMP